MVSAGINIAHNPGVGLLFAGKVALKYSVQKGFSGRSFLEMEDNRFILKLH